MEEAAQRSAYCRGAADACSPPPFAFPSVSCAHINPQGSAHSPDSCSWNLLSGSRQTLDMCPNISLVSSDGRGSPSNAQQQSNCSRQQLLLECHEQNGSTAYRTAINEGHKSPGGRSTILSIRSNVDQSLELSSFRLPPPPFTCAAAPLAAAGVVLTPPAIETPDTDVGVDCKSLLPLSELLRRQSSDHASVVDHLFLRSTLSSGSGVSAGSLANPAASYQPASARAKNAARQFSTEAGPLARLKLLEGGSTGTSCPPKEPSPIKTSGASEQRHGGGSNSSFSRQISDGSTATSYSNGYGKSGGLHATAARAHYVAIATHEDGNQS